MPCRVAAARGASPVGLRALALPRALRPPEAAAFSRAWQLAFALAADFAWSPDGGATMTPFFAPMAALLTGGGAMGTAASPATLQALAAAAAFLGEASVAAHLRLGSPRRPAAPRLLLQAPTAGPAAPAPAPLQAWFDALRLPRDVPGPLYVSIDYPDYSVSGDVVGMANFMREVGLGRVESAGWEGVSGVFGFMCEVDLGVHGGT